MYIELRAINRIGNGGVEFKFSSNIVRYIEISDCVIFLLNNNEIISLQLTTEVEVKYIIAWEKEFSNSIISNFSKYTENQKEFIKIVLDSDYIYIIEPNTGDIVYETTTKS